MDITLKDISINYLPSAGSGTLLVAASDASDSVKARADYVCNGKDDEIKIQAAIDSLSPVGGLVLLSEGNYATADVILLRSNLEIRGFGPATHVTGTIAASETNYGVFYTTEDISNCKIRDMRLTRASGGMGGVVSLNGNPIYQYDGCGLYNLICHSENSNCFTYSCGEGLEVVGCTFRGSDLVNSQVIEIGYAGRPRFNNCKIYGGTEPTIAYGILFTDNGGGLFEGCYIEGKNYGALVTASGNPRFVNCEIVTNSSVPLSVQACSAPVFESCYIHPKILSSRFTYAGVDEIEALVEGKSYRILSMHVRVDIAQPGKTMHIGSAPGGSDIAENVDLSTAGFRAVNPPWNVLFANGPIYLTPSDSIDNQCLRIMYSILLDLNQASIYITSTGNARFVNSYILGSPHCTYFTNNEPQFINCVLECPDQNKYAVNHSVPMVSYVRSCTLIGASRNVDRFVYDNWAGD